MENEASYRNKNIFNKKFQNKINSPHLNLYFLLEKCFGISMCLNTLIFGKQVGAGYTVETSDDNSSNSSCRF